MKVHVETCWNTVLELLHPGDIFRFPNQNVAFMKCFMHGQNSIYVCNLKTGMLHLYKGNTDVIVLKQKEPLNLED